MLVRRVMACALVEWGGERGPPNLPRDTGEVAKGKYNTKSCACGSFGLSRTGFHIFVSQAAGSRILDDLHVRATHVAGVPVHPRTHSLIASLASFRSERSLVGAGRILEHEHTAMHAPSISSHSGFLIPLRRVWGYELENRENPRDECSSVDGGRSAAPRSERSKPWPPWMAGKHGRHGLVPCPAPRTIHASWQGGATRHSRKGVAP